jgi:hypothetical protein
MSMTIAVAALAFFGAVAGSGCGGDSQGAAGVDGGGLDGGGLDGGGLDSGQEENGTALSAFGIFAGFTREFATFEHAIGFDHSEYLAWAGEQYGELGAYWTRSNLQLMWDLVEPTLGGGYDWSNQMGTDEAFGAAWSAGVHYLAVFHEGGLIDGGLRDQLAHKEQYEQFVEAAVERYDGDGVEDAPSGTRITHWQVGNETMKIEQQPNGVDDYVEWFTSTAQAVRRADPGAKMVLIASTDSSTVIDFHTQVITRLVEEGVRFDAVDIHHWGRAEQVEIQAAAGYRDLFESLGVPEVEIWSTEHGTYVGQIVPVLVECDPPCGSQEVCAPFPGESRCVARCTSDQDCPARAPSCHLDSGRCTDPVQTEADQARSLVERYVVNRDLGVRRIMWNNLVGWHEFGGHYGGIFDRIGLVSGGFLEMETEADCGRPRASWHAYKKLAEKTDELVAERLGPVVLSDDNLYVSAYWNRSSGVTGWVGWAWQEPTEPSVVELEVEGAASGVRVVSFIVDEQGVPTRDETVEAIGGLVTVEIGVEPVWIEPTF